MTPTGSGARRPVRLRPPALTMLVSTTQAVAAIGLLTFMAPGRGGLRPAVIIGTAIAFFVSESLTVHIPARRDSHSISLVEIPLVVAMVYLAPAEILMARLAGSGASLVIVRHQVNPFKLGFNLSLFALETMAATALYQAVAGTAGAGDLRAWMGIAFALVTFQTIGALCVTGIIWINDAPPVWRTVTSNYAVGLVGSGVAGAWGLITVTVVSAAPMTAVPLAALAIGLYWLLGVFGELRRRHEDLKVVHAFATALDGAADADELPVVFLEIINAHFMTSTAMLISHEGNSTMILTLDDTAGLAAINPTERNSAIDVLASSEADFLSDDAVAAIAGCTGTSVGAGAVVPIPATRAVLVVGNPRPGHPIRRAELTLLQTLATHAGSVFERHRLFGALAEEVELRQYQALHDELTSLPNRSAFLESVGRLLRTPQPDCRIAVLLLDIDDFKTINDTLSHRAGDHLLVDMAARLQDVLRSADIVARVGGDEFAAAIRVGSDADAIAVAQRIKDGLQHPFISGGLRVEVGASIGIAIGATNAITMLRQADIAMYAAKESDAGIEVYRDEIDDYDAPRLQLAGELREAIDLGQVVIYYQPKVRPSDGRILGFEALARWVHPTRGIVSPAEFIPVAEQTGLMTPFTEHVLQVALSDAAVWPDQDWTISVNFSPRTLVGTTALHMVSEVLHRTGVAPHRLVVEVTEGAILQERHGSTNAVQDLHDLGVLISIDDFGTGYSSLSRLRTLPIDELKIDRSFISTFETDQGNRAIVETTITLAQRLGLTTVAEGAEEASTVEELRRLGIDEIQGYYYSPPLPMDRLLDWIAQHEGHTGLRAAG